MILTSADLISNDQSTSGHMPLELQSGKKIVRKRKIVKNTCDIVLETEAKQWKCDSPEINVTDFISLVCILCRRSDKIYSSYTLLFDHLFNDHCIQLNDGRIVLNCPMSHDLSCTWHKSFVMKHIEKSDLADIVIHMSEAHQVPIPPCYIMCCHQGCRFLSYNQNSLSEHLITHNTNKENILYKKIPDISNNSVSSRSVSNGETLDSQLSFDTDHQLFYHRNCTLDNHSSVKHQNSFEDVTDTESDGQDDNCRMNESKSVKGINDTRFEPRSFNSKHEKKVLKARKKQERTDGNLTQLGEVQLKEDVLKFASMRCFLCHHTGEFQSYPLLSDHIIEEHCVPFESDRGKVLHCPRSIEQCTWKKVIGTDDRQIGTDDRQIGTDDRQIGTDDRQYFVEKEWLAGLLNHLITVHSMPSPDLMDLYRCSHDGCQFETSSNRKLIKHLSRVHKSFSCKVCGKVLNESSLESHGNSCTGTLSGKDINLGMTGDNYLGMAGDNNLRMAGDNNFGVAGDKNLGMAGDNNLGMAGDNNFEAAGDNNLEMASDNNFEAAGDNNLEMASDNNFEVAGDNNLGMAGDTESHAETVVGDSTKQVVGKASQRLSFIRFISLQCFLCGVNRTYSSYELLSDHIIGEHCTLSEDKTILLCPRSVDCKWRKFIVCGKFKQYIKKEVLASLLNHLLTVHDMPAPSFISLYQCSQCSYQTSKSSLLNSHIARVHNRVKCQFCDKVLKVASVEGHRKLCPPVGMKTVLDSVFATNADMPFDAPNLPFSQFKETPSTQIKNLQTDGVRMKKLKKNSCGRKPVKSDIICLAESSIGVSELPRKNEIDEQVERTSKERDSLPSENIEGANDDEETPHSFEKKFFDKASVVPELSHTKKTKSKKKLQQFEVLSTSGEVHDMQSLAETFLASVGNNLNAKQVVEISPRLSFIKFKSLQCFLCEHSLTFTSYNLLSDHIIEKHCTCTPGEDKSILHCPRTVDDCKWRKFIVCGKFKQYVKKEVLASLLNHLLTVHDMPAPAFISLYQCSHPGCSYQTSKCSLLNKHITRVHNLVQCEFCEKVLKAASVEYHRKLCPSVDRKTEIEGGVCAPNDDECVGELELAYSRSNEFEKLKHSKNVEVPLNKLKTNCCSESQVENEVKYVVDSPDGDLDDQDYNEMDERVNLTSIKRYSLLPSDDVEDVNDETQPTFENYSVERELVVMEKCINQDINYLEEKKVLQSMDENADDVRSFDEMTPGNNSGTKQVVGLNSKTSFIQFKSLQCFLCEHSLTFSSYNLLSDHIIEKHCTCTPGEDRSILHCPRTVDDCKWRKFIVCGKFKQYVKKEVLASLLNHLLTVHDMPAPAFISLYQCSQCSYQTSKSSLLNSHIARVHNLIQCEFCDKVLKVGSVEYHRKWCQPVNIKNSGILLSTSEESKKPQNKTRCFRSEKCESAPDLKLEEEDSVVMNRSVEDEISTLNYRYKCSICDNSSKEFAVYKQLSDHVIKKHCVKSSRNTLIFICPKSTNSGDNCDWKETIEVSNHKPYIKNSKMAFLLNHLISEHKISAPEFVKFRCGSDPKRCMIETDSPSMLENHSTGMMHKEGCEDKTRIIDATEGNIPSDADAFLREVSIIGIVTNKN